MEWTPAASGQNGWWDHKWSPFHSGVNGPCRLMVCQFFRSQAGSHVGPDWWVPEHLRIVFHDSFHGFFYLEDAPELFHCNGCSFSWAWVMGLPHRSLECHPPTDLLGLLLKLPQRWCRNFWALEMGLSSSTVVFLCVWFLPFKSQNVLSLWANGIQKTMSPPFFFFKVFFLLILGCAGFSWLQEGFLKLWASHCDGFSCVAQAVGTWASVAVVHTLWSTGSVVVAHGLSCSTACEILPDEWLNPCPLNWQVDS